MKSYFTIKQLRHLWIQCKLKVNVIKSKVGQGINSWETVYFRVNYNYTCQQNGHIGTSTTSKAVFHSLLFFNTVKRPTRVITAGRYNYCSTTIPYLDILKVQLEIYKACHWNRKNRWIYVMPEMKWKRKRTEHTVLQETWCRPLSVVTSVSFLLTPAVYLSKAFTVLLPPPPFLVKPIHNCRPSIVFCQMPASVHHCAGISEANCHLFISCASRSKVSKKSGKHRNTLGEERYGQSWQPVLEILKAYTCWEACCIGVVRETAAIWQ